MAEILVVEDNKAYREALVDMLTDEGYSVRTAENGLQALDMFAEKKPGLVLLDVMMPGRDGYAVCTEMRAKDPLVPILRTPRTTVCADFAEGRTTTSTSPWGRARYSRASRRR